jgi:hypothetical protein
MQIKGCATGRHSDIKPGNNVALGGCVSPRPGVSRRFHFMETRRFLE